MATFSRGFSFVKSLERAVEKYRPLSLPVIAGSYPVCVMSYILAENSLAENKAPRKHFSGSRPHIRCGEATAIVQ